jgi:protein-S-isoprenylcysteine O-methyltransferase Ste14
MPDTTVSRGKLLFACVYLLVYPALFFFLAGDWRWPEGWLFSLWLLGLSYGTIWFLYRHDPDLLAERFRKPGEAGQKGWDIPVVYGIMTLYLAWFVVMPLDGRRFGWSGPVPLGLKVLGGGALLGASFFLCRAFADNPFLSPLVRIQRERDQRVVSTGVYGIVRHPMYLGATFLFLGAPLLLGSYWGLAVGVVLTLVLVGRIIGEERVLVAELPGYTDYQRLVRYRLIPFVW